MAVLTWNTTTYPRVFLAVAADIPPGRDLELLQDL